MNIESSLNAANAKNNSSFFTQSNTLFLLISVAGTTIPSSGIVVKQGKLEKFVNTLYPSSLNLSLNSGVFFLMKQGVVNIIFFF